MKPAGPRTEGGIMALGGPGQDGCPAQRTCVSEWLHQSSGNASRLDFYRDGLCLECLFVCWHCRPSGAQLSQQYLCLIYNWNLTIYICNTCSSSHMEPGNFNSFGSQLGKIENFFSPYYADKCLRKVFMLRHIILVLCEGIYTTLYIRYTQRNLLFN